MQKRQVNEQKDEKIMEEQYDSQHFMTEKEQGGTFQTLDLWEPELNWERLSGFFVVEMNKTAVHGFIWKHSC